MIEISIIIPAHNSSNTIDRCVASIVKQNCTSVEIIIVENCSTDNTYELCEKIQRSYRNIKLIKTLIPGVSNARNIGLEAAAGKYIGFVDADDFIENGTFEYVSNAFEIEKLDILVTSFRVINADAKLICKNKNKFVPSEELIAGVLNISTIMGSVWNKFYRKELLSNVRFDEELSYCEDTHFNILVLIENPNARCLVSEFVSYNYCLNKESATNTIENTFDENGEFKYIKSFNKIIKLLEGTRLETEARYATCGHAINALHNIKPSGIRRDKLKHVIKRNFKAYLRLFMKYTPKHNLKRLLWVISAFTLDILD